MRLNNGFEIPQIGVGTWTLRGETARQNVRLALQAGFRHVDTAQMYENESEVGLGIADSDVLRHVGADWAAELDTHDPMVSPLYGDMQGLPSTELFTGTWEVFYTDIQKTYDKMKAAGVDVRLHVKEKMGHVYPLWPCPEGKEAREEIAEIIALTSNT